MANRCLKPYEKLKLTLAAQSHVPFQTLKHPDSLPARNPDRLPGSGSRAGSAAGQPRSQQPGASQEAAQRRTRLLPRPGPLPPAAPAAHRPAPAAAAARCLRVAPRRRLPPAAAAGPAAAGPAGSRIRIGIRIGIRSRIRIRIRIQVRVRPRRQQQRQDEEQRPAGTGRSHVGRRHVLLRSRGGRVLKGPRPAPGAAPAPPTWGLPGVGGARRLPASCWGTAVAGGLGAPPRKALRCGEAAAQGCAEGTFMHPVGQQLPALHIVFPAQIRAVQLKARAE